MTGITWHIITFSVIGIFLLLMAYRVISMARRPEHLRWELAPVPRDKGKTGYGGSYLEEYEWWRQPRQISRTAPIIYMLREIFTLKSVRENNPRFWPFSISLHYGIYLVILALAVYFINALLLIYGTSKDILDVFYRITTVIVAAGCITGGIGALGLILKRWLGPDLKNYSSFGSFFKLALLLGVFASAGIAMMIAENYAAEMSLFVKGIITLDKGISVSIVCSIHLFISLFFVLVLPMTNMVHFITKHFTYYAVRWNDAPLDERLSAKLARLAAKQPVWAARTAGEGKSWADLAGDNDEKT
jgi:nitrate reductase gamma subunit